MIMQRGVLPDVVRKACAVELGKAGVGWTAAERESPIGRTTGTRLVVERGIRARAETAMTAAGAKQVRLGAGTGSAQHYLVRDEEAGRLVHVEIADEPGPGTAVTTSPDAAQLRGGGALIAVVGGDGAGKSTVVNAIVAWLGEALDVVPLHLGKPPRTVIGSIAKGAVVLGRRVGILPADRWGHYPPAEQRDAFPGYAWLIWQVSTAHDRRRQYRRMAEHVEKGSVVVADRFPLPQLELMDGSRTRWLSPLKLAGPASWLVRYEQRCYAGIRRADVVLVLRVDPEMAVARKVGVDAAEFVRPRSAEVFHAEWTDPGVRVVDSSRSLDEVLHCVREVVWSRLP
jgi:thymidylate kinase